MVLPGRRHQMTQLTAPTLAKHHGPGLTRPTTAIQSHTRTSRHPPESDSREKPTSRQQAIQWPNQASTQQQSPGSRESRSSSAPSASGCSEQHMSVSRPSTPFHITHTHTFKAPTSELTNQPPTDPSPYPVRPRTPLHILHRPRRSRPAAGDGRRVCRRDDHFRRRRCHHHTSSNGNSNCCCYDQEDRPLGPQA